MPRIELVNINLNEFAARRSVLVLLVFVATVLATLTFWALLPARFRVPASDQSDYYHFYEPVARSILAGRGVSLEDGTPATLFPPGCPLILSGLFGLSHKLSIPEPFVLSTFAILTMGAISSLVFLMGRVLLSVSASLMSAAIWMTYPFALWLTRQPNSEVPFMLFLYAGLTLFWYLVIRRPRAWALFFFVWLPAWHRYADSTYCHRHCPRLKRDCLDSQARAATALSSAVDYDAALRQPFGVATVGSMGLLENRKRYFDKHKRIRERKRRFDFCGPPKSSSSENDFARYCLSNE